MSKLTKLRIKYIIEKLILMLIVLLLLSLVVFVIARMCPGDPLKSYYGDGLEHMSESQKEMARERLGLNDSIAAQYIRWVGNLFAGDLGLSFKYKQPVGQVISKYVGNTILLGGVAFIMIFGLAVLLGLFCASREDSAVDRIICKVGVVSNCIPAFFMALILILVFAVNFRIFPTGGAYSIGHSSDIGNRVYHLILPVIVLVLEHLWYYTYMIRNKLLEETRKDYVLLCKAEGISRNKILRKHCLKNILPSVLVVMAIAVPHILGGTYVVEMVFSYPGIGTLSFEAARYQDYNMLMALCMVTGIIVLFFNLIAQILGEFIDPRMRYDEVIYDIDEVTSTEEVIL